MTETTDGEFVVQSRKAGAKKRIYIGNLPQESDLKPRLIEFLNQSGAGHGIGVVNEQDVSIICTANSKQQSTCCYSALVAVQNVNQAMKILHEISFHGHQLVVQREQRRQTTNNTKTKQPSSSSFGGGGWSRPSTTKENIQEKAPIHKVPSLERNSIIGKEGPADEWDVSSEHNGRSIIATEIKLCAENEDDMDRRIDTATDSPQEEPTLQMVPTSNVVADNNVTLEDFRSQSKKPLSELLADYGEQDLNFRNLIPNETSSETTTTMPTTNNKTTSSREEHYYPNNRLTIEGKAPIHVELTSFGYIYGVPFELRNSNGWSGVHTHPLSSLVDCRHLPQVPHYMAKQNGLSYTVKRALLNVRNNNNNHEDDTTTTTRNNTNNCVFREYANTIANEIFVALVEAISIGGYGHAFPLRMTGVYVGSELGRHRSVLICELAATALRKLLRGNKNNVITQPVSVGTRHRDMERSSPKKEKEFESGDW